MYEFATVAFLGLAVAVLVDFTGHLTNLSRASRAALALVLGIVLAWATDYSVFAGYGIEFRELWMGTVATGLVIGGLAAVWREIIGVLSSYGPRRHEDASDIEARTPRAA